MLAHAAVLVRRPRDAVFRDLAVAADVLAFQAHVTVAKAAFEHEQYAFVVDPRLVPDLATRIVHIEALAGVTARSRVVLMDHATAVFARDVVRTGELAVRRVHLPFADPEIELP